MFPNDWAEFLVNTFELTGDYAGYAVVFALYAYFMALVGVAGLVIYFFGGKK